MTTERQKINAFFAAVESKNAAAIDRTTAREHADKRGFKEFVSAIDAIK